MVFPSVTWSINSWGFNLLVPSLQYEQIWKDIYVFCNAWRSLCAIKKLTKYRFVRNYLDNLDSWAHCGTAFITANSCRWNSRPSSFKFLLYYYFPLKNTTFFLSYFFSPDFLADFFKAVKIYLGTHIRIWTPCWEKSYFYRV